MKFGTPKSITTPIVDLCRTLNPASAPVYLPIQPAPNAAPLDCFVNVRRAVGSGGGQIQYGWAIWEWPNVYVEAEHHAVYAAPDGRLIDISPSPLSAVTHRLFLPDDAATFDFENEGYRRDNVRRALSNDPLIEEMFHLASERTAILNAIPGFGMVQIEGDDAERFQGNQERAAQIELQLGMKYTAQGAPCPCGSGVKFKRCHGEPRKTDR